MPPTLAVDSVQTEDVFCQIDSDCCNLPHWTLLPTSVRMVEFTILALKRPFQVVGLGPSHQYRLSVSKINGPIRRVIVRSSVTRRCRGQECGIATQLAGHCSESCYGPALAPNAFSPAPPMAWRTFYCWPYLACDMGSAGRGRVNSGRATRSIIG